MPLKYLNDIKAMQQRFASYHIKTVALAIFKQGF
jgi:hypothetical protein